MSIKRKKSKPHCQAQGSMINATGHPRKRRPSQISTRPFCLVNLQHPATVLSIYAKKKDASLRYDGADEGESIEERLDYRMKHLAICFPSCTYIL
jgi:hypothetical protein